jgi:hypothetical protein
MNEFSKYTVFEGKLQKLCSENNLKYSIQKDEYPFVMTIRPAQGFDAQIDMLESLGDGGAIGEGKETGYISPDASIVFAFTDGDLTYKTSKVFTISDALFSKIKNLFKNLHNMWMMCNFRYRCQLGYTAKYNITNERDDFEELPEIPSNDAED